MDILLILVLVIFLFSRVSSQGFLEHKDLSKKAFLTLLAIPAFFVIFLWRFFEQGVSVLGADMTVFLGLALLFFVRVAHQKGKSIKASYSWLIPLAMIASSYALFENEYIRIVSIFVFFFAGVFFAGNALYGDESGHRWGPKYLLEVFSTNILALGKALQPFRQLFDYCRPMHIIGKGVASRVLLGSVLLLIFSGAVVIPLLSSADSQFEGFFLDVLRFFRNIFDFLNVPKMLMSLFLFMLFGALGSLWLNAKQVTMREEESSVKDDAIVTGIVLGGTLLLYALFLVLQLGHLWTNVLPIDFQKTEYEVKSGFWQLFLLTLINIVFFIKLYAKDLHRAVRIILNTFIVSSLLLIVSAGQRVFLYNYFHGVSHEKFFAAYTVVFCFGVFVWFLRIIVTRPERVDMLRGLIFASIWAYAFATWLPLERMMSSVNMSLSEREGSRVDLSNMTAFSGDILNYAIENRAALSILKESPYVQGGDNKDYDAWQYWLDRQCGQLRNRKWYEQSLSGAWNYSQAKDTSVCRNAPEIQDNPNDF